MMDERQRAVKHAFSAEQLKRLSIDDLVALVGEAGPGAKFHGTGIVRKANGDIRYDPKAIPGDYHETEADLVRHAESVSGLE